MTHKNDHPTILHHNSYNIHIITDAQVRNHLNSLFTFANLSEGDRYSTIIIANPHNSYDNKSYHINPNTLTLHSDAKVRNCLDFQAIT